MCTHKSRSWHVSFQSGVQGRGEEPGITAVVVFRLKCARVPSRDCVCKAMAMQRPAGAAAPGPRVLVLFTHQLHVLTCPEL